MHRDAFWTPCELTFPLLELETFPQPVWEPACGAGGISRVLDAYGLTHLDSDLFVDYGHPGAVRCDFLRDKPPGEFKSIVTNPPYRKDKRTGIGVRHWVKRACRYRPEKVAMLLQLGAGFANWLDVKTVGDYLLKRVIVLHRDLCKSYYPSYRKFGSAWPHAWFVAVPRPVFPAFTFVTPAGEIVEATNACPHCGGGLVG